MSSIDTLRQTIEMVLADRNSLEIDELIGALSDEAEEAASQFCDRLDLGNWFYEALTLNDIDIVSMLSEINDDIRLLEKEAENDRAEIQRDYQTAQGWPV